VEARQHVDEHVLRDVLGGRAVREQPARERAHRLLVGAVNLFVRGFVTGPGAGDDVGFEDGVAEDGHSMG
jgi:hypothetical protein